MAVPTPLASGHMFPVAAPLSGSSWLMLVIVSVTASPSGSVTPPTETPTNRWFGGESSFGLATAPLQSGGWFCRVVLVLVVVVVVLVGLGHDAPGCGGTHCPVVTSHSHASPVQVGQIRRLSVCEDPDCRVALQVASPAPLTPPAASSTTWGELSLFACAPTQVSPAGQSLMPEPVAPHARLVVIEQEPAIGSGFAT
jgi:hypothetical protein